MSTITNATAAANQQQSSLVPSKPSVVIHLDLDCFYAQVEAVRKGISLDAPFGLSQWGSLLAISYTAKLQYGITRMDTVKTAREKCPEFQWVHTACYAAGDTKPHYYPEAQIGKNTHKVSLDTYREASKRIFAVLRSFEPDALEKGGTDEAFIDVTTLSANRIKRDFTDKGLGLKEAMETVKNLEKCVLINELICMQREEAARKKLSEEKNNDDDDDDNDNDEDDDNGEENDKIGPTVGESLLGENEDNASITPVIPLTTTTTSSEETKLATTPSSPSTTTFSQEERQRAENNVGDDPEELKMLLIGGALVCHDIRKAILDQLGYRTSAGVSTNRRVAKAASSSFKPNQQVLVFPSLHCNFLRSIPLSKLRGFGGKFGKKIRCFFGVTLTADLMAASISQLTQCLDGDATEAHAVYNIIRGKEVIGDNTSAVKNRTAPVSLMSQKAFLPAARTLEQLDQWIVVLATELQNRIFDCREQYKTMPLSINIKLGKSGLNDFSNVLNATSPLPSGATAPMIRSIVKRLCERQAGFGQVPDLSVNIITITATRMTSVGGDGSRNTIQSSLHQFFSSSSSAVSQKKKATSAGIKNEDDSGSTGSIQLPQRRARNTSTGNAAKKEVEVEVLDDDDDDDDDIEIRESPSKQKSNSSSSVVGNDSEHAIELD